MEISELATLVLIDSKNVKRQVKDLSEDQIENQKTNKNNIKQTVHHSEWGQTEDYTYSHAGMPTITLTFTHQARLFLATKVGTKIIVLMNYIVLKFNSNIPNNTSRGRLIEFMFNIETT